MRRFAFKLEAVLEQRKQSELQCQSRLAEAQRQALRVEGELQQLILAEKAASVPLRGRLDPRFLATQVRFSQVMTRKLARLRCDIEASKKDIAIIQAALIEVAKGRKVLEKLQEKQRQRWMDEQQKQEFAEQDDLSQRIAHEPDISPGTFTAGGP